MSAAPSRKAQAAAELASAGAIWGFGFVITVWTLPSVGPLWISALRFLLSVGIVAVACLLWPRLRGQFEVAEFRRAALPGFLLALMMVLQTWGMRYTTATNAGFITTLYVVLVPIVQAVFLGRRTGFFTAFLVMVALGGTALVAKLHTGVWNLGDLLTLGCALAAALHILSIDKLAANARSPLALNTMQSLWAGAFCLPLALALEPFSLPQAPPIAWVGIFYLTVVSTMIAFLIQIRAQRQLSPVVASLLFLLESPFSAVFALIFLGETMLPSQWFGGALILLSATLCVLRPETR